MSKAVLELQNLHKSFGALQATRDLSICVNAGEIHALIGPNGAGKTTLIQQIYGALKPGYRNGAVKRVRHYRLVGC
jgi:branched-chain amino acid transport system ATP-binding protein